MIDEETKNKLLKELEKTGNVYVACLKLGIGRATYYRWVEEDKKFKKKAMKVLRYGRENMSDISEHSLAMLIKDKDFAAIKYWLAHNSKIYRPKTTSKVILEHTRKLRESDITPGPTLEEVIDEMEKRSADYDKEDAEREKLQAIPSFHPGITTFNTPMPSATEDLPVDNQPLDNSEGSLQHNNDKDQTPKRDRRFPDDW